MASKHTKGPWKETQIGMIFATTAPDSGMLVAQVRGWGHLTGTGGGRGLPEAEAMAIQDANARLIKEAPAMEQLLRESQTSIGGDWRQRRDALLARIDGGE